MSYKPQRDSDGNPVIATDKRGQDIIHNPLLNKGSAFPESEQKELGLEGLVPPHISTLEEQLVRTKENYDHKPDNIEKYIYLRALQDRNETLFYALVRKHIDEMLPIIYTPTVGEAVQKYGHIYRNARGMFITPDNVDKMDKIVKNLPTEEIEVIVVTDNEGILGIGDQGVGGMAIPIGKLSLYTVGAGIHPATCLPVCLDAGTDNKELLSDPLYLGRKHKRLRGDEYFSFIENFMAGIRRNFPNALLQWEDFSKQNAFTNLETYRETQPSFNDDIQGTGAVTLGGIKGAMKIKGESLTAQKFAVFGAGAAGIGIARAIRGALISEGMSEKSATDSIFVIDSGGLLTEEREEIESYKRDFAKPESMVEGWTREHLYTLTLADVIKNGKITVLIGVSAQKDYFNMGIIDMMLKNTREPVIFPLSNPTAKAEADPRWILQYTGGAAIVASGSPFEPVAVGKREFTIGQGNNAFIFPGVGLGAIVSKARVITDELFTAAADALVECVSEERLESRCVYPPVGKLFEVSNHVAMAVYNRAIQSGIGTQVQGIEPEEAIKKGMWIPEYPILRQKN